MLLGSTAHHPVITQTVYQTNGTAAIGTRQFPNQLEADLATGVRGGNKHRLIARIWWHQQGSLAAINDEMAYFVFRTNQQRRTFAQLHADFDHLLPTQWQAKGNAPRITCTSKLID